MKLGPIDASRIEAMAAKLQAAAARSAPGATALSTAAAGNISGANGISGIGGISGTSGTSGTSGLSGLTSPHRTGAANESTKVSFSDSLKRMLDSVNDQQSKADDLSKRFALGDDNVNLSDVMIERQKASLSLQATVQVRNKLVSAYHEIMNMQV